MSAHLRVDPIACAAHGMCAELLPEMIALDEWGYPIVDARPLPEALVEHAEHAVRACPTFALLLQRRQHRERAGNPGVRAGAPAPARRSPR